MKKRGAINPFPKKMPATNSGIFSDSGKGQKLDPVKRSDIMQKTVNEAMAAHNRKPIR